MNAITEWINQVGQAFVEFAVPMLIQSGVLILILLLVDLFLRRKVRAVFRYWMWMLVLVKLVLPTSLSWPISVGRWFGDELAYVNTIPAPASEPEADIVPMPPIEARPVVDIPRAESVPNAPVVVPAEPTVRNMEATRWQIESASRVPESEPIGPPAPSATPLSWQAMALLVWLAVLGTMLLLLLQRAFFVRRVVAQAAAAGGKMADLLANCCELMAIRGNVGLKVSVGAASPAVCGLFRPVILVPKKLVPSLSRSELRVVLLHELAHIKRRDLWVNLIQTLLQILYFYNPLLWLANALIRRAREQAVDEMVLVAMGEKARQYPQTLVNVAKLAFKRPALSLRLIGVVESKSALTGRIRHILGRPMPKTAKLGILGLLVILVCGTVLLPMARNRWWGPDYLVRFAPHADVPPPQVVNKTMLTKQYDVTFAENEGLFIAAELYQTGKAMRPLGCKILKGSDKPQKMSIRFTREYENKARTIVNCSLNLQCGNQVLSMPDFLIETDEFYPDLAWDAYEKEGFPEDRKATKFEALLAVGSYASQERDADYYVWMPGYNEITQIRRRRYYVLLKMIPVSRFEHLWIHEPILGSQLPDGTYLSGDSTPDQCKAVVSEYRQSMQRVLTREQMPLPQLTAHKYYKVGDPINIYADGRGSDRWKPRLDDIYNDGDVNPMFFLIDGREYASRTGFGPFTGGGHTLHLPGELYMDSDEFHLAPGKHTVAYGWKNLDVVNPDDPDRALHYDRLTTDAVEFEVVEELPADYYAEVYEEGWEDVLRDSIETEFSDEMQKFRMRGSLLALQIKSLPFDVAFEIYAQAEGDEERSYAGRAARPANSVPYLMGCDRQVDEINWDTVGQKRWRLILVPSRKVAMQCPPIHHYYGREFVTDWATFEKTEHFEENRRRAYVRDTLDHNMPRYGDTIKADKPVDLDHLSGHWRGDGNDVWPLPDGFELGWTRDNGGTLRVDPGSKVRMLWLPQANASLIEVAAETRQRLVELPESRITEINPPEDQRTLVAIRSSEGRDYYLTVSKVDETWANLTWWPARGVDDGPFGRVVDKERGRGVRGATIIFSGLDTAEGKPKQRTSASEGSGGFILPKMEPGESIMASISAPGFEGLESVRIEHLADGTYLPRDLVFELHRLGAAKTPPEDGGSNVNGRHVVFLPDFDTAGVDGVFDLASGRMLSARGSEDDDRYFEKLGKGDLAYEYAKNKAGLICFRGATLQLRTDDGIKPLKPDLQRLSFNAYFLDKVPCQYQITTSEGNKYELKVLALQKGDTGRVQIEYWKPDLQNPAEDHLFTVHGTVTDRSGRPMKGVQLTADCGHGKLERTGRAVTDENGRYELVLTSSIRNVGVDPYDVGIQTARIKVRAHGYYEANICRDGYLAMSGKPPGPEEQRFVADYAGIVLPYDPYELNFVMHPAARIEGELVDKQGKPMPRLGLWLWGDGLYLSNHADIYGRADRDGKFIIEDIPCKSVWFQCPQPKLVQSDSINLATAGTYRIKLQYEESASGEPQLKIVHFRPPIPDAEKSLRVSNSEDYVSVDIEPSSSREQASKGIYRWRIDPPEGYVLDHGWFSLIDGEMKEHAGGGRDGSGMKKVVEFGLDTSIEEGFLVLKMQKSYSGQYAAFTCRTPVPQGSQLESERLSRYRPMTNTQYRSLWEGRFVRNGETVKTVVYCARIAALDDAVEGFYPEPAGQDPEAGRGVPKTKVLIGKSRKTLPRIDKEITGRTEKVRVEQLAHNADIDVEHDQVAAARKGRLVAGSRRNYFSILDESNGPRIEKRIYDELVKWSEQQDYKSEIYLSLVPWEKHDTFRGEFQTLRKSGWTWNRPKSDPPDVFLKVDLVKDGIWYVQGIEKQPKEWSSSLRLELLVAEWGQISPDQYDILRAEARRRFSAVRKPNSKWTTLLSNGVKVELVGVSDFPSPGKKWWAPDGSQIGYDPVFHIQNFPQAYEFRKRRGSKRFEVAFAISWSKCPNENKIVDMFIDDVQNLNRGGLQADNEVIVQPVRFADDQKTFDVKIRISTDGNNFETATFQNILLKPNQYELASGERGQLKVNVGTSQRDDAKIVGRVVDRQGQPAAGAQVALSTDKLGVQVSHGKFKPMPGDVESRIVETDSHGDFDLGEAPAESFDLIAVHDKGFGFVGADDYLDSPEIRLQPWGRIEGQLAPGRTASENKIWMAGLPNSTWLLHRRDYRYEIECDADGRFVFEKVPAGWFEVGYLIRTGDSGWSITSRTPIEVKAGETARMMLGGSGRPVVGKFVPPEGYDKAIYFGNGLRSLDRTRPPEPRPENYDRMTRREQAQWHTQWRKTEEYRRYRAAYWQDPNWRQYTFRINDDGSFRIEDVIAGKYDFTVWIEERLGSGGPPEEIGSYYGTIEVPEMPGGRSDEPLDLGELELTMHEPLSVGDMAPLFEAKTLEGKDLKLIDCRGKYVLLSFWQPVSHPEIERLRELYDAYHAAGRLEIVGLAGHDTLEEVKNYLEENPVPWPQIYTSEEFRSGIAKDYRIPGMPWIFLIDPDGTIAATGLRGEKLTSAVNEVIETASQISKTAPIEEEAPWGEPLNGLRMRVTAPAGTVYKRGMSLPLVLEIQNVSEQLIPLNSLSGFLSFKVTDRHNKRLGVQGYLHNHVTSWEGVNGTLAPGEIVAETCYLERLRSKMAPTAKSVTLHFQLPTQKVIPGELPINQYSNPITIQLEDSPFDHTLKSEDLPETWTKDTNLVYRERGFFLGDVAMHIDGKGRVTTIGRRPDAPIPHGRREYVADRDALDQLVRRLREFKLERLNVYDRKMFATDLVNVHLSLAEGGHVFSGEYELFGEKTKPVVALQKIMQEFLAKVVSQHETPAQGQSEEVLLENKAVCRTPGELLERFLELARAGDPAAGELFAENVDPEVTRLLQWYGGQANCEEMTAEYKQMRSELMAGLTEQRKQFYRQVRIWPDLGDKATQVGPRAYARLLKSNPRGGSWIRAVLMRESKEGGAWRIVGLLDRDSGLGSYSDKDYLNPWSPAMHPAWGETTEYRISAEDLARGCYIDFDDRTLHRITPGSNLTRNTLVRLGIDGKCGSREVGGGGGLVGIDLLARDGTFTWSLITPLNVQLASSLWMGFGSGGGGFVIKTREGNIGVMIVTGDANDYFIRFKMLNPACLGSTDTILRAVQADPRETAAHFLVGGLCGHAELDVSGFAQRPDLITKVKANRVTFRPVRLDTVYANNNVALAATSKFGGDEYRRFVLRLSKEGDRWLVTDVQLEPKEQDGEALRNFLEKHPDASISPSIETVKHITDTGATSDTRTITRDNLYEVARSSNYKVGPEWFRVAESADNSIYIGVERLADKGGEPRFNEVLDDWIRWKYDLDTAVDTGSAMALFETFCDQFDSEKGFFADDPRVRAIKLICDRLDTNVLTDRYVAALRSGKGFSSESTAHNAYSIDERKYTGHGGSDVLPASLSAVWYALLRIDEMLDKRYPASCNVVEEKLTPALIEDYEMRERQWLLDNAVLLGGPAVAEFLLQKDWRDEELYYNIEPVGSPPQPVNKWLVRLMNLDDPAGEEFRTEHRDVVLRFADTWAASLTERDRFNPPSFLMFDRHKGSDSFAWKYWPEFSDKTDRMTSAVQPLTFKLSLKLSYLKMLEPFTTTQMYFDCWVRALDELEDYYLEVRTALGHLPAHRKQMLAEMVLDEINKRLEKIGPGTEENRNMWSRLIYHRTVLNDFLQKG